MGFWSKLFGKKDEQADNTMPNPAAPAEETPEVSEEETKEE